MSVLLFHYIIIVDTMRSLPVPETMVVVMRSALHIGAPVTGVSIVLTVPAAVMPTI